jgi:phage head maturation protease
LEFWDDVPGTSWAKDLLTSMDRGDIDGAGAAFFISQHHWEQQGPDRVRVVEKARLLFISVDAFASAGRAVADTEEKIAAASKIGFALAMNQLRTKKGQHVI